MMFLNDALLTVFLWRRKDFLILYKLVKKMKHVMFMNLIYFQFDENLSAKANENDHTS